MLLHVATHSDGTITYSFGSSDEVPPATATIQLEAHVAHHEGTNGAAAPATALVNGSTVVASAAVAAKQLDKLLHLNPQLGNGRAAHSNTVDTSVSHRLETAADVASLNGAVGKKSAPLPTSSSRQASTGGPQDIDYAQADAASIDRMYNRCCDAGRLDEALTVVKGCIRAGRSDALRL